jgi:2-oxoglutarate ferredoxin oxidoreductase subunit alpha
VITAASVNDCYESTILAFKMARRHRLPVVLLIDAVIAHMREPVELPPSPPPQKAVFPEIDADSPRFGDVPFVPFGHGPITVVTGLSHQANGLAETQRGTHTEQMMRTTIENLCNDPDIKRSWVFKYQLDDADIAIAAYGITARAAREAVDMLRADGIWAGLLDLKVLWPFPNQILRETAAKVATGLRAAQLVPLTVDPATFDSLCGTTPTTEAEVTEAILATIVILVDQLSVARHVSPYAWFSAFAARQEMAALGVPSS